MLHSNKVPVDSLLAKMVLKFLLGLVLMYSAWKESFLLIWETAGNMSSFKER